MNRKDLWLRTNNNQIINLKYTHHVWMTRKESHEVWWRDDYDDEFIIAYFDEYKECSDYLEEIFELLEGNI